MMLIHCKTPLRIGRLLAAAVCLCALLVTPHQVWADELYRAAAELNTKYVAQIQRLEAILPRLLVPRPRPRPHDHLAAAIAQVEGLRSPLLSVPEHTDRAPLEDAQIDIVVVVDTRHHSTPRSPQHIFVWQIIDQAW